MTSLGNFGTPHEAPTGTFGYFGHEIRVNPELSEITLLRLARIGEAAGDQSSPVQMLDALEQMCRAVVHADDFDTFWSAAEANRQTVDDLGDVVAAVIEAVSERPTEQPSDSLGGPSTGDTRSEAGSSLPVAQRLEAKGRPDLALMVVQASA